VKKSIELGDVERTLLIPLYARALETRTGGGLLCDPKSVEMVEAIDFDFLPFNDGTAAMCCVLRTAVFDEWIKGFATAYPGGTVVEIGAGLNTRFERIDNGRLRWVDVDLPGSMRLRRQFFADTARRTSVAVSVLDETWADVAAVRPAPYFCMAEGVLVYLDAEEVKRSLALIARRFAPVWVAFDTAGQRTLDASREDDMMKRLNARIRWACDDPREVERWDLGYELLESRSLVDLPGSLERRLPFLYRYWTGIARSLRRQECDSYRLNLYAVRWPHPASA
jgi:O-methyltransferase involved in polyketide biosynthesis